MTTCPAVLGGYPTGLLCVRTDTHTTHRFEASSVSDGHDASEDAAERNY